MGVITQPLREEHQELWPSIELFRTVADEVGAGSFETVGHGVDVVYDFLTHHLLPHAQAEERALYPVVDRVLGAAGATATMSRDHVEITRLTEDLAVLRATARATGTFDAAALRRVLYGLYTLVKLHFAKEEGVYLPLLDARLTREDAEHMFAQMEAAAAEAKHHGGS
jgi:hemerythrin-like domain-containing protein